MTDTPRTDLFPCRLIERAIDEALHPKGMSTHSGKVMLDCSHVLAIIAKSRQLERELVAELLRRRASEIARCPHGKRYADVCVKCEADDAEPFAQGPDTQL